MDFSKFDARTAAEKPRAYHLRHQETGEPIMDGDKPCRVLIRGTASRELQADVSAAQAAKMKADAAEVTDDASAEGIHRMTCEAAARFIVGFENIDRDEGQALTTAAEDVAWFLDLTFVSIPHILKADGETKWKRPSFAQQIVDAAQDGSAFLVSVFGSAASRLGNTATSTPPRAGRTKPASSASPG